MSTPVVVPLRSYNLGNALSVLGTSMLLADRIGAAMWYRHFEDHEELFAARVSRQGEMTREQERFAGRDVTRERMFSTTFRHHVETLPAAASDEWFDYVEVGDGTVVVRRRHKYFAPLELVDEDLLRRYRVIGLLAPYQLSYQVAFDVAHLRERLGFSPEYVRRADVDNEHARGGYPVLVGVHLRLGDYRTWRDGRYAFEIGDVMALLARLDARAEGRYAFRVFSNDLDRDTLQEALARAPRVRCLYEPGDALTDFCALARCDLVLGPPSSYGHWAAFLGRIPRMVFDDLPRQRHVISPTYVEALRPVRWPFSIGLANDFWVL